MRGFGGSVVRFLTNFSKNRKGSSLKFDYIIPLSGGNLMESELYNLNLKIRKYVRTKEKVKNISNLLKNPNYLRFCYYNIKSREESLTKENVLNRIDENWFEKTAKSLINGIYEFGSHKKSSSNTEDKIVQEAIRYLLETTFDNLFDRYKINKSCYTTLKYVKYNMGASVWFIKGDISQDYEKINCNLLIKKINEVIEDQPFIDLIWKILRLNDLPQLNRLKI